MTPANIDNVSQFFQRHGFVELVDRSAGREAHAIKRRRHGLVKVNQRHVALHVSLGLRAHRRIERGGRDRCSAGNRHHRGVHHWRDVVHRRRGVEAMFERHRPLEGGLWRPVLRGRSCSCGAQWDGSDDRRWCCIEGRTEGWGRVVWRRNGEPARCAQLGAHAWLCKWRRGVLRSCWLEHRLRRNVARLRVSRLRGLGAEHHARRLGAEAGHAWRGHAGSA